MNKIEKSYSIKNKISVDRVNSNTIVSATKARVRQRCVEFKIEKIEQETIDNLPRK